MGSLILCRDSHMRIVIQHGLSKAYFNGAAWGADEESATEFENVVEAEQFCRAKKLGNALIVLKFKDGDEDISYKACDINLPVASHNSTKHVGFPA